MPWNQTNRTHLIALELVDADGGPVLVEIPDGPQPGRCPGPSSSSGG